MSEEAYRIAFMKAYKEHERGLTTQDEFMERVLFLVAEYLGVK